MAGFVSNFRKLTVWQKSYQLCLQIYRLTCRFPKDEKYGLKQQIRRAALSVPSNIAEGWGRGTTRQYIYSLYVAHGSLCELETQLLICLDLSYIDAQAHNELQSRINEIGRMLNVLINSLRLKEQRT